MSYKVEIGKNIVSLRKLKPISQEQLALGSEMSVSYLRAIEHGRANPTLDALSRLEMPAGVYIDIKMKQK